MKTMASPPVAAPSRPKEDTQKLVQLNQRVLVFEVLDVKNLLRLLQLGCSKWFRMGNSLILVRGPWWDTATQKGE